MSLSAAEAGPGNCLENKTFSRFLIKLSEITWITLNRIAEINEASESNDEIKNGNNAGNAPRPGPRVTPARDDKCVHPASQPQQPQPPPSVTAFVKF